MKFQEQVNMIRNNLYGMNPVSLLIANISEDQLAILFNSPIVEYLVSILGHQHDVVGDLTIAMAEAAQFQRLSMCHRLSPPFLSEAPSIHMWIKSLT